MDRASREAATDNQKMMAAAHAAAVICRLFRAPGFRDVRHLGLTPQAMSLSRVWRSIVCRILLTRTSHHPGAGTPSFASSSKTGQLRHSRPATPATLRTPPTALLIQSSSAPRRSASVRSHSST
jgi:hypothetical protein